MSRWHIGGFTFPHLATNEPSQQLLARIQLKLREFAKRAPCCGGGSTTCRVGNRDYNDTMFVQPIYHLLVLMAVIALRKSLGIRRNRMESTVDVHLETLGRLAASFRVS